MRNTAIRIIFLKFLMNIMMNMGQPLTLGLVLDQLWGSRGCPGCLAVAAYVVNYMYLNKSSPDNCIVDLTLVVIKFV